MIKITLSKVLILILLFPLSSFAGDTGKIKMRARVAFTQEDSSNKFSATPSHSVSKPFSNGMGVNLSSAYFFNERIASELTVGVNTMRLKNTTEVANAFSGNYTNFSQRKSYFFPISLGVQFYPFKAPHLNTYLGTGLHYTFVTNKKYTKLSNSYGPFAQAGLDLYNSENSGFNFDVKKYWTKVKIHYKVPAVSSTPLVNKATINPWVFSTGIYFEF